MRQDFIKMSISFIIGVILILLIPKSCDNKKDNNDELKILRKIDSLNKENLIYSKNIILRDSVIKKLNLKNDSLEKLKTKIKQNHVINLKKIDTITVNSMVDEFKNIFTKANINS